jgi:hypothetical protein
VRKVFDRMLAEFAGFIVGDPQAPGIVTAAIWASR